MFRKLWSSTKKLLANRSALPSDGGEAQYHLGRAFYEKEKNFSEAFKCFRALAETGHADAQCCLAVMFCNGDGVEQNFKEAFHWYLKSAQNGCTRAKLNLGLMFKRGDGVLRNIVAALDWFQAAAKEGCVDAQSQIEQIYSHKKPADSSAISTPKHLIVEGHPELKCFPEHVLFTYFIRHEETATHSGFYLLKPQLESFEADLHGQFLTYRNADDPTWRVVIYFEVMTGWFKAGLLNGEEVKAVIHANKWESFLAKLTHAFAEETQKWRVVLN